MRLGSQGRRWLVSTAIALCLDVAGLGLVGIMLGSSRGPSAAGLPARQPASLRVSLGPASMGLPSAALQPRTSAALPKSPPAAAPAAPPGAVPQIALEAAPVVGAPIAAPGSVAVPEPGAAIFVDPGAGQVSGAASGLADDARAAGPVGAAGKAAEILRQLEALIRDNLVYPPLARKRNIQGEVRVSLLIGTDGTLTGSTLVRGSGSSILDNAAIALVQRLFPLDLGQRLGEPTRVIIRIVYSLTS